MTKNIILEHLNTPEMLEALYQSSPNEFIGDFNQAFETHTESETLKVWHARLNYSNSTANPRTNMPIGILIVLCLIAGFIAKLPTFFHIDDNWYFPRFIPLAVIGTVIFYFLNMMTSQKIRKVVAGGLLACTVYAVLLPNNTSSASIAMALIHLPLLLLSLLAVSFMSDKWDSVQSRLSFIQYIGEVSIYSVLILLGGMVLTGITLGLFSLINLSIEEWYVEYIVVLGLVSTPLIATYLFDAIQKRQSKFSIILSNVFSPLFLVTIFVYLMATIYQGESPYSNREFLIIFNGLLVVILAITIFSVSGRERKNTTHITDFINMALIGATLMVNIVALSAIIFRWTEYGVTLNRVVVTGANLLIFIHLALLLKQYIKQVWYNADPLELEATITKYLPVYSVWSLIVVLVLPIVFQYK
ncbi:Putative uncharacterized protein [Moritella viscosa]|uniref:hypothetical protein n=1 Tax=Moritella viscosa TaxID=80854 RepID=UPI0009217CF5|nr:hypothetical protein [Moritella viscosa]SGY87566.1 Putative uncharacterized protein [Moritella viscosa]